MAVASSDWLTGAAFGPGKGLVLTAAAPPVATPTGTLLPRTSATWLLTGARSVVEEVKRKDEESRARPGLRR
jgi:hypothetical protein